jgi:hypothetical protein
MVFCVLTTVTVVVRVAAPVVVIVPVMVVTVARLSLPGIALSGAVKHAGRETKDSCN